jgi:hypothetical protein
MEHPPLALCAWHWKANQLLSEMLCVCKPGIADTEVTVHTNTSSSGSKRKWGNSGTQTVANNKQKKQKPKHEKHKTSRSEHEDHNNGSKAVLDKPPFGFDQEPSMSFEPAHPATSRVSPAPNRKGREGAKTALCELDFAALNHFI